MATLATGGPSDPLRADAFNGDTNGNGTPDGEELDTDGDGTPDANDVNLDDGTAGYQLGPLPRYAVFPITNAQPSSDTYHAKNARQISDKGTVLYLNGTWTGGTWTPLSGNGPDGSASALSINDHNVIVGVCPNEIEAGDQTIAVSTGCWWPAPTAAPQLISTSDGTDTYYPSADSMDWLAESMHCGPLLSNDGKFLMAANHVEDGTYQWSHHALWQLPAQTGQSVTASSADRGLRYNQSPNLWGSDETNSMGVVSQGLTVSNPSRSPVNVAQLPGGLLLAMTPWPDSPAEVLHQGAWQPATTYSQAIDISSNGTAIGKSDNTLTASILLNGKWTGIERAAPSLPSQWKDETVALLDTTPSGWILTQRGDDDLDYAVMLPLTVDGVDNAASLLLLEDPAAGVDRTSMTALSGSGKVDEIWIMAPIGGSNPVRFRSPLNPASTLQLECDQVTFTPDLLNSPDQQLQVSGTGSATEDLQPVLKLGNQVDSLSAPIKIKVMKKRVVKVALHKVVGLDAASAQTTPKFMPTVVDLGTYLDKIYGRQVNTTFDITFFEENGNGQGIDFDLNDDKKMWVDGNNPERATATPNPQAGNPGSGYNIDVWVIGGGVALMYLEGYVDRQVNGLTYNGRDVIVDGDIAVRPGMRSAVAAGKELESVMHTIAHEIGHVMTKAGHPDDAHPLGSPVLTWEGTNGRFPHVRKRLMCSGPNKDVKNPGKCLIKRSGI